MGYWQQAAESKGKERAPKIPAGQHDLEVKEVVFAKRDGPPFTSADGDPQILVVYQDDRGNEASEMYTLSEKAGWKLAKMLAAAGANIKKLDEANVPIAKFAEERFARVNLVGRKFVGDVEWETGKDGKEYARVTPLAPDPALAGAAAGDDIPI